MGIWAHTPVARLEETMMPDLLHYAGSPIELDRSRTYQQEILFKPYGFWVSAGAEWAAFCGRNHFHPERLTSVHRVVLTERANILRLSSAEEIDRFSDDYATGDCFGIDWPRVARQWQGIVIDPYCYARQFSLHTKWYYAWGCASGCVWDLAAIESLGHFSKRQDQESYGRAR